MINNISLELLAPNLWKVYLFNRLIAVVKWENGKLRTTYTDGSGLFSDEAQDEVKKQLNEYRAL